jgi:membrane-associated phospholipid phosphatase
LGYLGARLTRACRLTKLAAVGQLDLRAFAAVYGGSAGPWGPVMVALTILGGGWAMVALLPLVLWARTRHHARFLLGAIVAQASTVWALKRIFGRVRPWLALGLPAPLGRPEDGSFPSGHAAGSFCVAAFLVMALAPPAPRSGLARAFAPALWLGAALVALSRVYLGAHFPSDVVAGALIGASVGVVAGRRCRASADPSVTPRAPSACKVGPE